MFKTLSCSDCFTASICVHFPMVELDKAMYQKSHQVVDMNRKKYIYSVGYTPFEHFIKFLIDDLHTNFKACVCYFLSNFYFSPNDSPSKTMKNVLLFHLKSSFRSWVIQIFVFLSSPLFLPVSHFFRDWSKINLKVYDITNCPNKTFITHFLWYHEKEKRYNIETFCIDRVLNKEQFYGKIIQKMCTKS